MDVVYLVMDTKSRKVTGIYSTMQLALLHSDDDSCIHTIAMDIPCI